VSLSTASHHALKRIFFQHRHFHIIFPEFLLICHGMICTKKADNDDSNRRGLLLLLLKAQDRLVRDYLYRALHPELIFWVVCFWILGILPAFFIAYNSFMTYTQSRIPSPTTSSVLPRYTLVFFSHLALLSTLFFVLGFLFHQCLLSPSAPFIITFQKQKKKTPSFLARISVSSSLWHSTVAFAFGIIFPPCQACSMRRDCQLSWLKFHLLRTPPPSVQPSVPDVGKSFNLQLNAYRSWNLIQIATKTLLLRRRLRYLSFVSVSKQILDTAQCASYPTQCLFLPTPGRFLSAHIIYSRFST